MTGTLQKTDEIDFLTYCRLTANVYPDGKDKYNPLLIYDNDWKRMDIFDENGQQYENNLYDFDKIQKKNNSSISQSDLNGLDAAIYKNNNGKVIVVFRGTEFQGKDNDVHESAKILNEQSNLPQFEQLNEFYNLLKRTLSTQGITEFELAGHSLGGALSIAFKQILNADKSKDKPICTKVTTINPINVNYYLENKYAKIDTIYKFNIF